MSELLSGRTQLVGVMGWPVAHSVSPPMHNAALRALGLDWAYIPLPVPPDRLAEAVRGARALGLRGFNATVPHKQALLSLVDELTPAARAIGAVNTVVIREGGGSLGHNTDAGGFIRALREAGFAPDGCGALILGAGGAARAVVYALASVGARVTICNRTAARAEALADEMRLAVAGAAIQAAPLDGATLARLGEGAQLIVNTTTLGMWPEVDGSPWPDELPFPRGAFAYDLVYNPRETAFIRQARAAGAMAADGLGMLIHQGAEAFALWTGQQPPIDIMRAACERALEHR